MRTLAPIALCALLLTGCVSVEERRAQDDSQCQSYGAEPGSEAYVQCRMWAETEHRKREEFNQSLLALSNANTSSNTMTAFCPGFERGYRNGYSRASGGSSRSFVPSCPVQPLKRGMQSDFDQGYEIGMERGMADGEKR
jgi:hypothetical protein